ncbi:MAG: glycosyltransferase [Thiogranum sp.]|nr:glycosyltransferase [Thiogranum sp.]
MLNIPIVVIAYNRQDSLLRLLTSLDRARYPSAVKLIISIDGGGARGVIDCAQRFAWKHGEKHVIAQERNLGLREHVMRCGRMTRDYDGIVLLEDDIYVSPYFYSYMIQALSAYRDEPRIAGVALYSHRYNETARLPFEPVDDGYDVFFMQIACSWGQGWLRQQWSGFEHWYEKNHDLDLGADRSLPPDVRVWPTSWKKYFIRYLVETGTYFAYPRLSLSTNFGDSGEHHAGGKLYQVPLLYGETEYRLPALTDSIARYDAWCEIEPEVIRAGLPGLAAEEFAVDLYGMKQEADVAEEHVLTRQPLTTSRMRFGLELKPHELNILENIAGEVLLFGKTADLPAYNPNLERKTSVYRDYVNTCLYYYAMREDEFVLANSRLVRFLKRIIKRLIR